MRTGDLNLGCYGGSLLCFTEYRAESEEKSASVEPSVDPKKPALPIAYPLKTLEELESRSCFDSVHYFFNKCSVPLPPSRAPKAQGNRCRLLVCHDMAGGYLDDKWVQGDNNSEAYAIWHWYLIDIFFYFFHILVTVPPPRWTNTAHRHGVRVARLILQVHSEITGVISSGSDGGRVVHRVKFCGVYVQ